MPMGQAARSFLKGTGLFDRAWVLMDTEAGVEHFGRGILDGADSVFAVAHLSREEVTVADKAYCPAGDVGKPCGVVLSRAYSAERQVIK